MCVAFIVIVVKESTFWVLRVPLKRLLGEEPGTLRTAALGPVSLSVTPRRRGLGPWCPRARLRVPRSPGDVSARFSGKGLPQTHTQGTPSSANTRKARPGEESVQKLSLPEHLFPGECEPRAACTSPHRLPFVIRGSPGSGPWSSQIT